MNRPALTVNHSQSQTQSQTLTPRLQFAVRLLQLSALDYEQELHALMAKNPFLELDESAPARTTDSNEFDQHETQGASEPAEPATDFGDAAEQAPGWEQAEQWQQSGNLSRDAAANPTQVSATDLLVSHGDLRHHLREQVNLLRLSARDRALACSVVDSLDEDGYCRVDLLEIGAAAALEPAVDACEIGMALRLVQSFDPCGVGARSVAECQLLQ